MFLRAPAAIAALLLASCGSIGLPTPDFKPYRMEIQQGNFVSQDMVSKLKLGMSKDQVRFVLGTPLITDSFHADRWDYVFRRQRANSRELEHRKIAVFFEDGKLKRIEGDVMPAATADSAGGKPEPQANAGSPAEPKAAAAEASPKPADAQPSGATPADQPQEKSWWQRLKDKF